MEKETFSIVFAGEVDHGKSTLIGRILYETNSLSEEKMKEIDQVSKELGRDLEWSFIMDSLREEREQNVTIDTTQTFFKTKKRNFIIIDAPGHRDFIKNMMTGASQAEIAILLVDAKEGIRDQTKRHLNILSLIGIKQIILVVNKMDLVNYNEQVFKKILSDITPFAEKINISIDFAIPISAKEGENLKEKPKAMPWFSGPCFLESLDIINKIDPESSNLYRMPIQDVYKIDDKRIYVGRVDSGSVESNQEILISPKNKKTKVKSIEKFLIPETKKAIFGECIGIITQDHLFLERGDIISGINNPPTTSKKAIASLYCIESIPIEEKFIFKIGTKEIPGKILKILEKIDSSTLEKQTNLSDLKENDFSTVEIEFDEPSAYDYVENCIELSRLVIEKFGNVIAAGIIQHPSK